jgi:FdhD protein
MGASIARVVPVRVWRPERGELEDRVVAEEPLEIRVCGTAVAITLRTPGDDEELAAGFTLTEGLVRSARDIDRVTWVEDVPPEARGNVVDVHLTGPESGGRGLSSRLTGRPAFITAACGVCGRGTLEAVRRRADPLPDGPAISRDVLASLPDSLRSRQVVFEETGGLHAAGLFDTEGRPIVVREDVGRHNAVDKVIGFGVLGGRIPLQGTVLQVSGRAGFEIVLKAWVAGIPVLASVSAPSHLAVELALEANLTLLGFVRGGSFSVYSGRERVR